MNAPETIHPPEETLYAFLQGETSGADETGIRDHLSQCTACRRRAQTAAETLDVLRDALAAPIQGAARLSDIRRTRLREASQRHDESQEWRCNLFESRTDGKRRSGRRYLRWLVNVAAVLVAGLIFAALLMPAGRSARERARAVAEANLVMERSERDEIYEREQYAGSGWAFNDYELDLDDLDAVPDIVDAMEVPRVARETVDALDVALVSPDTAAAPALPRGKRSPPREEIAAPKIREAESPVQFRDLYASRSDRRADVVRERDGRANERYRRGPEDLGGARHEAPTVRFNPVVETDQQRVSTFSIDTDTAAYTMARRAILEGERPDPQTIRPEEFINYFDYNYAPPRDTTFSVTTVAAPSPFRPGFMTLKIGVRGRGDRRDPPPRRTALTILVDGSGSMNTHDRIGMVRRVMPLLLEGLHPRDSITLVRFDRTTRLLLEPTPAGDGDRIMDVINAMEPGGATNLEEGLRVAYELAARHYMPNAANRVLLFTDGVANLGADTAETIIETVAAKRQDGIDLSIFGLGMGTYDDRMLKTLAARGNGTYLYLDSIDEARRLFVDDVAAAWHVIARDVRIQVEFNPDRVERYRQVGYEPRQLTPEQFRDPDVNAGEVGYGKSVTALYELVLAKRTSGPLGVVRVRYRDPDTLAVREFEQPITDVSLLARYEDAPPRFQLAAAIAEWAEWLRGNPVTAGVEKTLIRDKLAQAVDALTLDVDAREALYLMDASGMLR